MSSIARKRAEERAAEIVKQLAPNEAGRLNVLLKDISSAAKRPDFREPLRCFLEKRRSPGYQEEIGFLHDIFCQLLEVTEGKPLSFNGLAENLWINLKGKWDGKFSMGDCISALNAILRTKECPVLIKKNHSFTLNVPFCTNNENSHLF